MSEQWSEQLVYTACFNALTNCHTINTCSWHYCTVHEYSCSYLSNQWQLINANTSARLFWPTSGHKRWKYKKIQVLYIMNDHNKNSWLRNTESLCNSILMHKRNSKGSPHTSVYRQSNNSLHNNLQLRWLLHIQWLQCSCNSFLKHHMMLQLFPPHLEYIT